MHVNVSRNVCGAYHAGISTLLAEGAEQDSRAGRVLAMPTPVTTVTLRPRERVLFCAQRDANPFFHLSEALWMLAGRDDARWLDQFVRDFSFRFAQPDGTLYGAYGQRWRGMYETDQLEAVVRRLRENHRDRRVVIQMWDANMDLWDPADDSYGEIREPKDLPCNTHIYPAVRDGEMGPVLDVTVCCRSNDAIWGTHGANAVHFSMLQEYLAAGVGVGVGTMYQVSNNYHVYLDVLSRVAPDADAPRCDDRYTSHEAQPGIPLVAEYDVWLSDLGRFLRWCDEFAEHPVGSYSPPRYQNPWFSVVAAPMYAAYCLWRAGERDEALAETTRIRASDWRTAAAEWMSRRLR